MTTEASSAPPERAYEPRPSFHDELFEDDGTPRPARRARCSTRSSASARRAWATPATAATRSSCSRASPSRRSARTARARERPFPLDLVPRILSGPEWRTLKRGPRAAHPRAEPLRRRRLPRARDRPRGHRPVEPGRRPLALRARRPRHPPARRRLLPRRRLRPRARQRRHVEGARGQRAHAVGDLVRAREPRRDDAPGPGPVRAYRVRPVDQYPQLLLAALRSVAPSADGEATVVVWTPGPDELGLLRARVPRAPDGRRAGRGLRPRRARRRPLHAHDARPRPRPRDLPPPRRRLHRPARVPPRLDARRPGPDPRLPRRHRRDRQRDRHRRRRRQGDLPLRPRDDPVLPRRGAAARERADLPAQRARAARVRAREHRPARRQADRRVRRQGRPDRPDGDATRSSRGWPRRCAHIPSAGSPRRS